METWKRAWNETMSELDREWIFEDTSGSLDGKVLAKRFGLRQGENCDSLMITVV